MRVFGSRSVSNLKDVHPALVAIAYLALQISESDFTVIEGHRGEAEQEAAFKAGNTKAHFGQSAHNTMPAVAIDVIPYPFHGWEDFHRFKKISDAFFKAAKMVNVDIRWGGDWHKDGERTTNDAWDKPHFELNPWRKWA